MHNAYQMNSTLCESGVLAAKIVWRTHGHDKQCKTMLSVCLCVWFQYSMSCSFSHPIHTYWNYLILWSDKLTNAIWKRWIYNIDTKIFLYHINVVAIVSICNSLSNDMALPDAIQKLMIPVCLIVTDYCNCAKCAICSAKVLLMENVMCYYSVFKNTI